MFKLQRHTRKKDQVVHIPEDPNCDDSFSIDSDVLEDTVAAVEWKVLKSNESPLDLVDILEKKTIFIRKRLSFVKKDIIADLILVSAELQVKINRFLKLSRLK